jgi:hypothetical protein
MSWSSPNVQSRTERYFSHFFYPKGKAGGIQIRRCQGIAVKCYGGTLGALALNPSGFCNDRVKFIFFPPISGSERNFRSWAEG